MGCLLSQPSKGNNSQQARPSKAQHSDPRRPTTSKLPSKAGQAAQVSGTIPSNAGSSKATKQQAPSGAAPKTNKSASSSKAKPPKSAKAQPKKATPIKSGGPSGSSSSAASKTPPRLLEVFTAPQDDLSLTKSFTATYRALLDHSVEFYSPAGWKGFKDKAVKTTFQKYFVNAETLLKDKNLFKWVMLGVVGGFIWDWADQGILFHHFRTAVPAPTGGPGGSSNNRATHITRIDRNKLLNVLKTELRPFSDRKELEQQTILGQLSKMLLPFTTKKQQARHVQSLLSLISKILDIKILLEIQPGKWGYRANRSINAKGAFESTRMEVLGGPANGKVVQGICWPALEKGGEGAGGKVGERGVVLAKMKVMVR